MSEKQEAVQAEHVPAYLVAMIPPKVQVAMNVIACYAHRDNVLQAGGEDDAYEAALDTVVKYLRS